MWREGRRKVLKATRPCPAAAPVSTASTSSRQTLVFHFPPFFPSFLSAPHMSDSTPRLPSASCPPAESAQRGSSETSSKGLSPEGLQPGWVPVSLFPQNRGHWEGPRNPPRVPCCCTKVVTPCTKVFFFFCKSLWCMGRGVLFKFTLGRAPWGSRSNLRTGCLSSATEKRIAQGLSLSRSWIKLQTQTPPFSTQQTVMANIAMWTLNTNYK